MAKLSTILDQIDAGSMLLPEFQRGYVWSRDQVRGFMRSLYLGYPVGALLVWETDTSDKTVRGGARSAHDLPGVTRSAHDLKGMKQLLLDGQQRITSLYGVARGVPPAFFEGDPAVFTGLRFHLRTETFEFYAPVKMKDDPFWVDVTDLFVNGLNGQIERLALDPQTRPFLSNLLRLQNLLEKDIFVEQITGADKTTDVVVEIFNRVNSGGTKLSKGDLALAKICAEWGEARPTMRSALRRWEGDGRRAGFGNGYQFSLDWLLRVVNAVATGRAPFSALDEIGADEFEGALHAAVGHVDTVLREVGGRLGLDHDRVLMNRTAIAVLARLLHENGGEFNGPEERDKALFWYVHASLSGRFAASTETYLNQDLDIASTDGVDGLISRLRRWRGGTLTVRARDLEAAGRGARYYPLLYLVSRVRGARDFGSGELTAGAGGGSPVQSPVQVQPLFPKAALHRSGYRPAQVNAIANFVLLTPASATQVVRWRPEQYLDRVEAAFPGVLASQCLPPDPSLWKVENYLAFLKARRELLARAANEFLESLRLGDRVDAAPLPRIVVQPPTDEGVDIRAEEVERLIDELTELGLAAPERDTEISDPETGRALAVAEAVWPNGLQTGQGQPVVLELDPDEADLPRLSELGYEVFTSVEALRGYALRRSKDAAGQDESPDVDPGGPVLPGPAAADVLASTEPSPEPVAEDPEHVFHEAMAVLYERARAETGYPATYLLAMLAEDGGVATAKRLLASATVSTGFSALWNRGRLDLTVENLVLDPRFGGLFTPDELDVARDRLDQFDYIPSH